MVPDPWEALAATDVLLLHLPIAQRGRYYRDERTIVLRRDMLLVEQRATLWHELVHHRRGDRRCDDGWFHRRQEAIVDREAARLAIPLPALIAACRGALNWGEIADTLKTTRHLLQVRRNTMHPAERAILERHIAEREEAA